MPDVSPAVVSPGVAPSNPSASDPAKTTSPVQTSAGSADGSQVSSPPKSKINVDAVVKADREQRKTLKDELTSVKQTKDELAAQAERFKVIPPEVLEHMSKGEIFDAIKKLEGGKLGRKELLELADIVAEREANAEPMTTEQIQAKIREESAAAVKRAKDEDAAAEQAKKDAKKLEDEKAWDEEVSTYQAKLCGEWIETAENKAKFPLFHDWATADDEEEIVAAKAALLKKELFARIADNEKHGRPVAHGCSMADLAAHFEAKESAKRPKTESKAPVTLDELTKAMHEQAAKLMPQAPAPKTGVITIETGGDGFDGRKPGEYIPKGNGSVADDVYAELNRMEKLRQAGLAKRKF